MMLGLREITAYWALVHRPTTRCECHLTPSVISLPAIANSYVLPSINFRFREQMTTCANVIHLWQFAASDPLCMIVLYVLKHAL